MRRDDLGRLAPGAKADIVLIDMRTLRMGPYRDPIKALVQCGTGDDVSRVIVDGRTVVEGGHVVGVDEAQVLADAQGEAERLWAEVPEWHWQKLSADELSPASFPPLTMSDPLPVVIESSPSRVRIVSVLTVETDGRSFTGRRVRAGVPHFVIPVPDLTTVPLTAWAPAIRYLIPPVLLAFLAMQVLRWFVGRKADEGSPH